MVVHSSSYKYGILETHRIHKALFSALLKIISVGLWYASFFSQPFVKPPKLSCGIAVSSLLPPAPQLSPLHLPPPAGPLHPPALHHLRRLLHLPRHLRPRPAAHKDFCPISPSISSLSPIVFVLRISLLWPAPFWATIENVANKCVAGVTGRKAGEQVVRRAFQRPYARGRAPGVRGAG